MRFAPLVLLGAIASCTWNIPGLPGAHADDALACEDAVSRLESCCGAALTQEFTCVSAYRSAPTFQNCNHQEPSIDDYEAVCIVAASCDDLVRLDACHTPRNVIHWPSGGPASCAK